ncbi:CPBP family intramembrane glutamic endopeptidase [Anaerosacchariphilus polymeriproducens]|uniref:CPBP family intramembrane metalloprotease n=1 Tax=Anaerosacchariphilus polymeriproducens TaxID=1812858 RepID=A0A371AT17_9FIRM|nr:CPBP family intramembrane glutamic endopeptidase [Anaerosacchariphilus polymeriproducens]RDU22600.1 CPBP family intramembrane metalloprotease [Anaerosacchariphilus polymeriproducens]
MNKIDTKGLLLRIFIPTLVLSFTYLLLGHFCKIPHLLLFCILGTVILVPIELGVILSASKKAYGTYSLKSAFVGQEKLAIWKVLIIAFAFFGIAGLLSSFIAPIENQIFADIRTTVLNNISAGFDWTKYEYLKSFSKPILILTCVFYGIFNVLLGPITEELFFRGYLTSHYEKQSSFTPILIVVLFSLYHFWLPFNNVFRILAFAPVAYVAYKKKNLFISIFFHCFCNLFSVVGFVLAVLG